MTSLNPFRPTFGASPLFWAGRSVVLDSFRAGIAGGAGDPHRAMIISGHRGMGKTVLLTELEDIAATEGWVTLRTSGRAHSVQELIESVIPAKIRELSPPNSRTLTGFRVAGVGLNTELVDNSTAPKPTLESQLRELLGHLKKAGILITIDEIQDADPEDMTTVAVAFQNLIRDGADIAIVMAGLTPGIDSLLNLPGTTFLRRAQRYHLGPLSPDSALEALEATAADSGINFGPGAALEAARLAQGYPYLVQLVGFLAWRHSANRHADTPTSAVISTADVKAISAEAIAQMGHQVHSPALRPLPPRQMEYVRALAALEAKAGDDSHESTPIEIAAGDIADHLNRATTSLSEVRSRLITKGIIDSPRWGYVCFPLPYMGQYLNSSGGPQIVN